ncbi:MAG: hypothetical protein [Mu-like cryoconite phage AB09]|nr:MAG: hypothetical protein [Mu-like cryoconite phage AB09]
MERVMNDYGHPGPLTMFMPKAFRDDFLDLQTVLGEGAMTVEAFLHNCELLAKSLDKKLCDDSITRVLNGTPAVNAIAAKRMDAQPGAIPAWWEAVENWAHANSFDL